MINPSALTYIDLGITFFIGLLIGLAVKKAIVSFILLFIAFLLATYVGLTFVPSIPPSKFFELAGRYFHEIISSLNLGVLAVSLSIILFLAGLAVGILKG